MPTGINGLRSCRVWRWGDPDRERVNKAIRLLYFPVCIVYIMLPKKITLKNHLRHHAQPVNLNLARTEKYIWKNFCMEIYIQLFIANSCVHTEKYFWNLNKSNRNQIVFTIFELIWNQMDGRTFAVPNQSENDKYNLISVLI